MRSKDRKRASMSFSGAELDALDIVLRGLRRGSDLKVVAAGRQEALERVLRKASRMTKRIAERKASP